MTASADFRPTGPLVRAAFDGVEIAGEPGSSVAAALIGSGVNAWRTTRDGASRGLFCGIGVCFDCIVEIDGDTGQRSCMIPLSDGMDIRSNRGATTEESPA